MKTKVESAQEIIRMIARSYKNPIIYSGFGKDSICVVHLCHSLGFKWDVMFHRDPYFPLKYRYANTIIQKWGLVARDYPAHKCTVFWHQGVFEVVRHYQTGTQDMVLCALLYEPEIFVEGQYLCALKDIYQQPKGNAFYMWDVGLQGHRAPERKPHSGMKPNMLRWPMKHTLCGVDWCHPIWDWTEEDVFQYIIDNGIPVNTDVYDISGDKLIPKADSTYNPDRRPACYRCMVPSDKWTVACPKKGVIVNNIAAELERVQMPNDYPEYEHSYDEPVKEV